MTIIIETPQPPVREAITITRLHKSMLRPAYSTKPVEKEVLDPSTTRDATPADLERAGWVPRAALEARREYNELVGRGLEEIGKVTEAARAAGWNGSDNPKAVWDFIAHLAAERNEARAALSAMGLLAHRRDTDGPSAPEPAGRATDEELAEAYRAAYGDPDAPQEEKHEVAHARALRAVAERVRREDLIARCVEAGLDLAVVEAHDDAERAPGLWYIVRITESGGEETEATVPAADVPATVERLLGEVTRGR